MSYDIGIGEAIFSEKMDDETLKRDIEIEVKKIFLDHAPVWADDNDPFPDMSGKSNYRYAGYSSMVDFCKETGLYEFFFNPEDGLIRHNNYPGSTRIFPKDLKTITQAKQNWIKNHPNHVPGWKDYQDPTLAKLIWYEFWFEWALKNCRNPIINAT
ncbi:MULTISPECIES: hypothetical protein [Oceanobacillus]|uniref:hypothetical protein n=1 Tax=Oceanobacillus TaxID=182709 RepID=UPI00059592C8|nr:MULTISPECIES: hypothetical protein [Oceanobacillus]